MAGGDNFGLNSDHFVQVPENVAAIYDLLDNAGISRLEYRQHLPYSGYQGFKRFIQETGANDYVRKHNPDIAYGSVVNTLERLARMQNFTKFEKQLKDRAFSQWAFITPEMMDINLLLLLLGHGPMIF